MSTGPLQLRHAIVHDEKPLLYSTTAPKELDRPEFVRAASSLQTLASGLLTVVQDDNNFVAVVSAPFVVEEAEEAEKQKKEFRIDAVHTVPIPKGHGGARHFEESNGTKKYKLDLEASVLVPGKYTSDSKEALLAFGSGSKPHYRDVIVYVSNPALQPSDSPHVSIPANDEPLDEPLMKADRSGVAYYSPDVTVFYAADLYKAFRSKTQFCGSELNIEGVELLHEGLESTAAVFRFYQRGNGAEDAKTGLKPVNATGDVPAYLLFSHLNSLLHLEKHAAVFEGPAVLNRTEAGSNICCCTVENVKQFSLGEVDGTPLSFTDVCNINEEYSLYLAAAEDSADAITDGESKGSKVGLKPVRPTSSTLHSVPFRYADGTPFTKKTEGLTVFRSSVVELQSSRSVFGYVAVDADDPNIPSTLCLCEFVF